MNVLDIVEKNVSETNDEQEGAPTITYSMPLNTEDIKSILPHRYPFLLVDRIIELEPGKRAVGIKAVTVNEPFFQGHFPVLAIMPGVLLIEAMAQVGGIMMLATPMHRGKMAYLVGVEKARFRRPAVPGDSVRLTADVTRVRGEMGKCLCRAEVDGVMVAESEIMFALRRR